MPEFAQFVALRDSDTAFPASGRLFTFDLADLDDDRTDGYIDVQGFWAT
jgi:hypothetical protein